MMLCPMRTTLTIDDDLAGILHRRAAELGKPFKEVVNSTLRKGLSENLKKTTHSVAVIPHDFGKNPGINLGNTNQLGDELKVEDFPKKAVQDYCSGHYTYPFPPPLS